MNCGAILIAGCVLFQTVTAYGQQRSFAGTNVTGQLVLIRTVNAKQAMQTLAAPSQGQVHSIAARIEGANAIDEFAAVQPRLGMQSIGSELSAFDGALLREATHASLSIGTGTTSSGFMGLTHFDQRNSNGGNQLSLEPPSPSIAVGNGYILEGVNNAIQVYTTAGKPMLPRVLSTNELFGLPAAINRSTTPNRRGVNPTDMRVFFDYTINRWFVLQRALENDETGIPNGQSHLYLAVSQTDDPAGVYNIYSMDTRDNGALFCPCFVDFPQIGADQYGFYIASNEYGIGSNLFINAQIHAISKASLAAGAPAPTTYRFVLPPTTGYEFSIQPTSTPPGASYFLGSGGLEYFVSSRTTAASNLMLWAMYNTSSLATASPNPTLVSITVPTLSYVGPDVATQKPGPLPFGSSLFPPRMLPFLDGGQDSRILSAVYSGGRVYVTFATQVRDENGRSLVGGAYVALSPTVRAGILSALVPRQDYLVVRGQHTLRPAIAVNGQGQGAIAFTLTGPDYYPSAAFVPITPAAVGSIQIAAAGTGPEDGFTGYDPPTAPVARWGDYSGAVVASDGSIWMVTEYIPTAPRTEFANWGTYIARFVP